MTVRILYRLRHILLTQKKFKPSEFGGIEQMEEKIKTEKEIYRSEFNKSKRHAHKKIVQKTKRCGLYEASRSAPKGMFESE